MRFFVCTSGYWLPSLISDRSRCRTVFSLVSPCCPTPKTWVKPLKIRSHRIYKPRYALRYIYFRLPAAIFEFSQIHTSDGPRSSLIVQPHPENMSVSVGTSLLSCIRAEINVMSFFLPVNGCHHRISTYPDVGQYSH